MPRVLEMRCRREDAQRPTRRRCTGYGRLTDGGILVAGSDSMARYLHLFVLVISVTLAAPVAAQEISEAEQLLHAKALSQAFRRASEQVRPAVVTLQVRTKQIEDIDSLRDLLLDPRLRRLLPEGLDPDQLDEDKIPAIPGLNVHVGSGVIVDPEGTILTNHHVVADADEVTVRLADGREFPATDTRSDALSDLAIVRIQAESPLPVARFGDSDQMNIGDWVIAIGNPFELEATVSAGIISGKGRGIEKIQRGRLLQTDAAINPGNSGGPLVNLDGEVVGINTAIATSSGGYQGVGFAIPANRAQWIRRELLEHGTVRRAYLGIGIEELRAADATRLELAPRAGVWVRRVMPDSAAAEAGLQENDVIVAFAGERVRMPRDLQDVVEQSPIGSTQPLEVQRSGESIKLEVVLRPIETATP